MLVARANRHSMVNSHLAGCATPYQTPALLCGAMGSVDGQERHITHDVLTELVVG
jgi:hypothetical protein